MSVNLLNTIVDVVRIIISVFHTLIQPPAITLFVDCHDQRRVLTLIKPIVHCSIVDVLKYKNNRVVQNTCSNNCVHVYGLVYHESR